MTNQQDDLEPAYAYQAGAFPGIPGTASPGEYILDHTTHAGLFLGGTMSQYTTNFNIAALPASQASTLSSVAGSASSVPLLAANANRKAAYFYNDSTANLYLAFSNTASTTAYTVKLPAGAYYEAPTSPVWQGAISGIWDSTSGSVRITEVA